MANDAVVDKGRRRFLTATTSVVGGAGVALAAIPFVKSWEPSERAKSAGAPVLADIGKIEAGQKSKVTDDFMIFARIESLILDKGLEDAVARARAYVGAGVDGIMIHSRRTDPSEIFAFCDAFARFRGDKPLVVVPSSYNAVTEDELVSAGANIVIYANQLIRAAYPAMVRTAESILANGRSLEADGGLMAIKDILHLIPGGS